MDLQKLLKDLKAKFPVLQEDETMQELEASLVDMPMEEGAESADEAISAPMDMRGGPMMEAPPPEELGEEEMPSPNDTEIEIELVSDGEEEGMDEEASPMHAQKMKRKGGPNLSQLKKKPLKK